MNFALTNRNNGIRYRIADPFAIARSVFGFDPFVGSDRRAGKEPSFSPRFEVRERESQYLVSADLPGVKDEDVEVSIHDNVLTVSGKREADERSEGETYRLNERFYGSFSRSFALPDDANGDEIAAELRNGVLRVTIGKRAEAKPRKIRLST